MKVDYPSTNIQAHDKPADSKKKLQLVRAGHHIAGSLIEGDIEKAFNKAVISGIKLANYNPFIDPLVNPLRLAEALRDLGQEALVWTPETLFSVIDRKYNGWTNDRATDALEKFHDTGIIQTEVPPLVRQKIYAIRIVATSDTAHNQWHIFEKVGCAFNDRLAQFGVVERLSSGECARTLAVIESIRPDEYAKEIRIYIAASAHEDGLLTIEPSKYLKMADLFLQQMNFESTGTHLSQEIKDRIKQKVTELQGHPTAVGPESIETIQAMKLLAVDSMGDLVISSHS